MLIITHFFIQNKPNMQINNHSFLESQPPIQDDIQTKPLRFITDYSLWNILFPRQSQILTASTKKLTRAEAFVDLINRQCLAIITNDDNFLQITAVALSKAWGWDRTTVKKFILALQKINAISCLPNVNGKTVIRINNILGEKHSLQTINEVPIQPHCDSSAYANK